MSMPILFETPYRALVLGASGAIGGAFVELLRSDPHCEHIEAISRQSNAGFDLTDEASIRAQAEHAKASGPYQLIVDATGALSIDGQGPEKSLSQLSQAKLMSAMSINAIGPLLVLQHFAGLLAGDLLFGFAFFFSLAFEFLLALD